MKKLLSPLLLLISTSYGTAAIAQNYPLGDGKIATQPTAGFVYSCQMKFDYVNPKPTTIKNAPWLSNTTWLSDTKATVQSRGRIAQKSQFQTKRKDKQLVITGNGIPNHITGIFPIQAHDPAFQYDNKGYSIKAQPLSFNFPDNPQFAAAPYCVDAGMVGVALTGAAIYSAIDQTEHDAMAHEVHDQCGGHPDRYGQYHYHSMSSCFRDDSGKSGKHSDLVGYALDGFGIYGDKGENGKSVTNEDLDECHGHTGQVKWQGKMVNIYHYHLNDTYPYSVGCFKGTPAQSPDKFTFSGEFEPQNAMWLMWPTYTNRHDLPASELTVRLIETLTDHKTTVKLLVPGDGFLQAAQKKIPQDIQDSDKLLISKQPYGDYWARDQGPVFLRNGRGELAMVDLDFPAWGYMANGNFDPFLRRLDAKVDRLVAQDMKLPMISSAMFSEGGDREFNGKGTLLLTEVVQLNRNPGKTLAQIEAEYKRLFGVTNVIWLKQGIYEDNQTFMGALKGPNDTPVYTSFGVGGHVDEYARFTDAHTILLAEVDPEEQTDFIGQENAHRLEVNYQILKNAKDQDGKPFNIIRMPLPKPMIEPMDDRDFIYQSFELLNFIDGSVFPKGESQQMIAAASYFNFVPINDIVLAPKYYQAKGNKEGDNLRHKILDDKAKATLQQAFPDREIVMMDVMEINWGGGGMHCITMHEPKTKP